MGVCESIYPAQISYWQPDVEVEMNKKKYFLDLFIFILLSVLLLFVLIVTAAVTLLLGSYLGFNFLISFFVSFFFRLLSSRNKVFCIFFSPDLYFNRISLEPSNKLTTPHALHPQIFIIEIEHAHFPLSYKKSKHSEKIVVVGEKKMKKKN